MITPTIWIKVLRDNGCQDTCLHSDYTMGWMIQGFIYRSKSSCSSPTCQTSSGAHKAYSTCTKDLSWGGLYGQGIRFTTHLYLVLKLRISPIIFHLTPKSLHSMKRGEFTFTLFSRDDSFCPPSPSPHQRNTKDTTSCVNWLS